jgi:hypothetical protein
LPLQDEGAATCRGKPTPFNAPAAGRSIATVGEIALVVQVSVLQDDYLYIHIYVYIVQCMMLYIITLSSYIAHVFSRSFLFSLTKLPSVWGALVGCGVHFSRQ